MKSSLKFLLLLCITVLMAGCKLAVIVVEGGEVRSSISGTCVEGTICVDQIVDTDYTAAFTAVPNSGWVFVKWNAGDDFLCKDSTDPVCVVSNEGTEGNEAIEAIIASKKTFYIMPVFREAAKIVEVAGREWFQPVLVRGLSLTWNDIDTICPHPEGICDGNLNGHDMTGWTWANVGDVNALFNHYIGGDSLGPGPDFYVDADNGFTTSWASAFYADGWLPTLSSTDSRTTEGWTRDKAEPSRAYWGLIVDTISPPPSGLSGPYKDSASTEGNEDIDSSVRGSWFYRDL